MYNTEAKHWFWSWCFDWKMGNEISKKLSSLEHSERNLIRHKKGTAQHLEINRCSGTNGIKCTNGTDMDTNGTNGIKQWAQIWTIATKTAQTAHISAICVRRSVYSWIALQLHTGSRWDVVIITRSDFKPETIFRFLNQNYTGQSTCFL